MKSILANPQLQRVATNYIRMIASFLLGIFLLRLLLTFGEGVFAAVALTASSIGVAAILKESVRGATIPELGISYHSGDIAAFRNAYASSFAISLIAGLFGVLVLGLFWLFLDSFSIDDELRTATALFIVTRMVSTFVSIAASPIMNMLPVTGRMVSYNFWLMMDRVAEVGAAYCVFLVWTGASGADVLLWFGILSMVSMSVVAVLGAVHSMSANRDFIPDLKRVSFGRIGQVFRSVGWNGAAVASVNLYLRFDVFAVNIFYGVGGTVIFGIASQLAAYTRQITMGLITGLDAVVSKSASAKDDQARSRITDINVRTTELQAISLFGAAAFIILHARWIIEFLFSDRLSEPASQVPVITASFLFLMVGMIARGLSEGWMSILAGSGRIRDYALPVFIGALLNPILVIACYFLLNSAEGLLSVSIVFMILNIVFHMIAVPYVTAKFLQAPFPALIKPMLVPGLVVLASTGAVALAHSYIADPDHRVAFTILVFGVILGPWFLLAFRKLMRLN